MSNTDQPNEPIAPAGVSIPPSPDGGRPTRPDRSLPTRQAAPRNGGSLALALLLSLLAVMVCGYVGWQQWQQKQNDTTVRRTTADLQQRVVALETTLAGVSGQRSSLSQRLDDAAQVNRSLREELLEQAERTRHLEDAVAKLAEKSLSGHDATLLDETESLLRMASERYTLFHDGQGAAAAYALADQTLAAVNDSAFTGVRLSIGAERAALAASQPASQANALQQLAALRGALAGFPLRPLDTPGAARATDAWSRIGRALTGVISVQRDNGAPLAVADARFARELAALDLAQAQAALLAHDSVAYVGALQRVELSLSTQFDTRAAVVQQARTALKQLAAALPATAPVALGAALSELRNLRTVHALGPAGDSSAPTPATAPPVRGVRP